MSDKRTKKDPYSKETVRQKRTFPTGKTVAIFVFLALQILIILFAIFYTPSPQDEIDYYEIIAEPQSNGTLLISYKFTWTPLDDSEDLTWVDIGMANESFAFIPESFSQNISSHEKYTEGDYVSARLYLDRPYEGGETLTFSFSVLQSDMLCKSSNGYFYEFVPGWFNSTPVKSYRFVWGSSPLPSYSNAPSESNGSPTWTGSMPCGSYVKMRVHYDLGAFVSPETVKYKEFYDGDVADDLKGDKIAVLVLATVLCVILLIAQIYMFDSMVSYHRGRGFLSGYGHPIHVYGRVNPRYEDEQEKHAVRSGGRHVGGGCACACACACAGGGRAGCSQKDTNEFPSKAKKS